MLVRTILILIVIALCGCAGSQQNVKWANKFNRSSSAADISAHGVPAVPETFLGEMTSEELERSGDILFRRGDFCLAYVKYEKALQLNPESTRILYKKGLLLMNGGANEDAIQVFESILSSDPDNSGAYLCMGQACFQMKKFREAKENLQRALILDPGLWKAHSLMGIVYDCVGQHDSAISEYAAALRMKPDKGYIYNNLGISSALTGQYETALDAFNKALEVGCRDIQKIYNNKGLVLAKMGRYSEALQAFRKGGSETQAYNNLGCVYLEQNKWEKAVETFECAMHVNPKFDAGIHQNLKKARMHVVKQN
jgi:tetratricopeptide (TPR) repeat protein